MNRAPTIRLHPRHLETDGQLTQTMVVTGYPHDVRPGWADQLLTYPGKADIAFHLNPVPTQVAGQGLRRRRARLESAWRAEVSQGRLEDPQRAAAAEDAAQLAERVATGETRLFQVAVYITVHAPTAEVLEADLRRLAALAGSILVDLAPTTFRPWQAWRSTLPLGTDALKMTRTVDTEALAALMPLSGADLSLNTGRTGVVLGENLHSNGLVSWDRFHGGLDNSNAVIVARSGSGKSFLAKTELLRSLYTGVQVAVIDPTDEYAHLAEAVGGNLVPLGSPEGRLNPFDLTGAGPQAFFSRTLFVQTLVTAMVGSLDAAQTAALDRAVIDTYAAHGITQDPQSWNRPAPILSDLVQTLRGFDGDHETSQGAGALSDQLAPFVTGSRKALFDGPTTGSLTGHLSVISLRHLPEELKTVGLLTALDALWRQVTNPKERRPRLITIDEGWTLLRDPIGARYVFNFAKNSRRYWAGITLITQDVADLLSTDLGRAVAANAATQLLLRQAPQALDAVCESFHLSQGERQIVATAERGVALLAAGRHRAVFRALASPVEHRLITTDPVELARLAGEF